MWMTKLLFKPALVYSISVIPASGRPGQEDSEFRTSLGYLVNSKPGITIIIITIIVENK